jgi:hypothetical protein
VSAILSFALDSPSASPPGGLPSALIDPTDIVALVLMALFAIHRIEVRGTEGRAFPDVPRDAFEDWHKKALFARSVLVNGCFAKFFLNNLVFYGLRSFVSPTVVWTFGKWLFFVWAVALAYGLWTASASNRRARELGIVIGRKVIEERRTSEPPAEHGA